METIQQQKVALRRRLAAREQAMTQRERELSDRAIIYHVTRTEEYRRARTVFAFVGCGREIGTRALLERILSEGKELCVPLCTGPGRMECRRGLRGRCRRRLTWLLSPVWARRRMAGAWAGAAATMTAFWPGIPAPPCYCAGKGSCARIFPGRPTTSAFPP